ncbi:acyl carrier protein phosphodiesterase [Adhaeribacter sp. BT258]|uniref:Acyl carrier protein phosphodiesterase n=1 Tax=Adhaeribacter terrigena TaxID=2793070 RepID=A0ABS1C0V8_9BACT|nr:acyl carrier protein phosphodiesterase [Adhaeribacter terrigena]MBK0403039.1 acyl carrier protein phosphodiesterase [Adhaeribacter terrigena]
MNYLAHVFLSGPDTELMIGNFIADAVRGKQILQFSEGIRQGILLHREIDAFTDVNDVVAATKNRLRPEYGKYAPVIADMFYDHFLAANFEAFSPQPLSTFTAEKYSVLQQHWHILPERVKQFLPHMMQHNWLLSYAELKGINQALTGLSRRTTFHSGMETAALELEKNYELYAQEFRLFFPELIAFSQNRIAMIGNPKPLP